MNQYWKNIIVNKLRRDNREKNGEGKKYSSYRIAKAFRE